MSGTGFGARETKWKDTIHALVEHLLQWQDSQAHYEISSMMDVLKLECPVAERVREGLTEEVILIEISVD